MNKFVLRILNVSFSFILSLMVYLPEFEVNIICCYEFNQLVTKLLKKLQGQISNFRAKNEQWSYLSHGVINLRAESRS